ncbi:hypothetical protein [Halanaerobium congolense]|jgi:DNA-binding cell septation regulator SpoVG|uniref:hypothetical protein n=1 Tax=Halanaerobium congolense TaxID=54121 RepID=UPI000794E986|nr:hypothetical protein [Halanaerobium congolense]KXS47860.1 MAG: hypothetical protein AWL62_2361 [Halanaerobium sp. T82-1]SDH75109.1 hypothetical protein SAMN04515651_1261 [Halanaerobium congolense]
MKYNKMFEIVKELEFDNEFVVKKINDINKNFQIFLRNQDRHFRPNHLGVLIDLNLRVRSRPDLKKEMAKVFDNIYYKKDPDQEIQSLLEQEFEHFLNPLEIIANLS